MVVIRIRIWIQNTIERFLPLPDEQASSEPNMVLPPGEHRKKLTALVSECPSCCNKCLSLQNETRADAGSNITCNLSGDFPILSTRTSNRVGYHAFQPFSFANKLLNKCRIFCV